MPFQTKFSNAFSWMKMFEFRLRFHWSLFPRVQLTIFHDWASSRRQAIIWTMMVSLPTYICLSASMNYDRHKCSVLNYPSILYGNADFFSSDIVKLCLWNVWHLAEITIVRQKLTFIQKGIRCPTIVRQCLTIVRHVSRRLIKVPPSGAPTSAVRPETSCASAPGRG